MTVFLTSTLLGDVSHRDGKLVRATMRAQKDCWLSNLTLPAGMPRYGSSISRPAFSHYRAPLSPTLNLLAPDPLTFDINPST